MRLISNGPVKVATHNYAHSHFKANEFGDGGCKRSAQVRGLLHEYGIAYTSADFKPHNPASRSLKLCAKGLHYNKSISLKSNQDHQLGRQVQTFENFVAKQKPSAFIWESAVGHQLLLAKVLNNHKVPFVALPRNIESLVQGSRSFTDGAVAPHWFTQELHYLKLANKVFTVSLREQWLLSLYGIDAGYLPYYPTASV